MRPAARSLEAMLIPEGAHRRASQDLPLNRSDLRKAEHNFGEAQPRHLDCAGFGVHARGNLSPSIVERHVDDSQTVRRIRRSTNELTHFHPMAPTPHTTKVSLACRLVNSTSGRGVLRGASEIAETRGSPTRAERTLRLPPGSAPTRDYLPSAHWRLAPKLSKLDPDPPIDLQLIIAQTGAWDRGDPSAEREMITLAPVGAVGDSGANQGTPVGGAHVTNADDWEMVPSSWSSACEEQCKCDKSGMGCQKNEQGSAKDEQRHVVIRELRRSAQHQRGHLCSVPRADHKLHIWCPTATATTAVSRLDLTLAKGVVQAPHSKCGVLARGTCGPLPCQGSALPLPSRSLLAPYTARSLGAAEHDRSPYRVAGARALAVPGAMGLDGCMGGTHVAEPLTHVDHPAAGVAVDDRRLGACAGAG
jgi:hypothetical protein